MPRTVKSEFDAAVLDPEEGLVALVRVKAERSKSWEITLPTRLSRYDDEAAFVVAVDLDSIWLYKPVGVNLGEPIAQLETGPILRHYDPDFPRNRIFDHYPLTLAEAWLRDLAYHWKSVQPPGSEELKTAGLLEAIEEGSTIHLRD